jgi:3-oxoacyl-(acyl-carrier-protein) synthase
MFPEPLYIYGLKGSVGHTMATSGGVETAYSITGLREGWIPYTSVTDDVLDTKHKIVLHNILEKETNNFIKLSFGFGGVSTGILVEK